jgi:hypothetical protein
MLTTYGYGLVLLAIAPHVLPIKQSSVWVATSEALLAVVFWTLALLLASRGEK